MSEMRFDGRVAVEGAAHGIKANSIGPGARTVMSELCAQEELVAHMPPAELVAPTVAFLCHQDCDVSGGYFTVAAGATRFGLFAETEGIFDPSITLEGVRDNFGKIMNTDRHTLTPEPLDNPMSEIIQPKHPYVPA